MNEIEYLNETNDSPFIGIAVGSFDLLSGIRLCHAWVFQKEEKINEKIENALKVTLANVHRQSEEFYNVVSTSIIEMQNFKWFITNTIFLVSNNTTNPSMKRNKFISVIFIFKSILIRNDFHLKNSLLILTRKFAQNVKSCFTNNHPFTSLKEYIDIIIYRGSCLIQSGIPKSYYVLNKEFKLSTTEFLFYATLLTSHIQTKMTTVIETSSLTDALQIVSFLINFMFPFQIDQSSIQHMLAPVPGLFLQIVEKQKQPIGEIVRNFNGPVTWLRIFDRKKIFQFASTSKFKPNASAAPPPLESFEVFSDGQERDAKPAVANWSLATVQLLLSSQSKNESKVICEQQFSELARHALFFVAADGRRDALKKAMDVGEQDERLLAAAAQAMQTSCASD